MVLRTGISPSELGVQILQNCRNELCSIFPQLDLAFASLDYVPDPACAGIGTDGESLRFAPVDLLRAYQASPAAVRRGYLHTLLHCIYLHPLFGEAPPRFWDLACDLAVEAVIQGAAVPRLELPASPVRQRCFQVMDGSALSAGQLCGMLERGEFPFSTEDLEAAFRFDSHRLWRQVPNQEEVRQKWSGLGAGAAQGGSSAGTAAGTRQEAVLPTESSRYDYRSFLRRFVTEREEVLLDPESFDMIYYSLGLERYGNLPLIEPLEYQEAARLAEMVIAIDTSGSCPAETVGRFLSETWEIVSRRENFFRKMKVYLIQCDCCVQRVDVIRSPEDWRQCSERVAIQGRGGTDFTPVFRYVEELRGAGELRDLRVLLYFTDGDGVYPRQKTDYETAFVFLKKNESMRFVPSWAAKLVLDGL